MEKEANPIIDSFEFSLNELNREIDDISTGLNLGFQDKLRFKEAIMGVFAYGKVAEKHIYDFYISQIPMVEALCSVLKLDKDRLFARILFGNDHEWVTAVDFRKAIHYLAGPSGKFHRLSKLPNSTEDIFKIYQETFGDLTNKEKP